MPGVSFHYLLSNGKYRLRVIEWPPRFRNRGVYLTMIGIARYHTGIEEFRHWHRIARLDTDAPGRVVSRQPNMPDLYAMFSMLLFFFLPFFPRAAQQACRKRERGGRKIHYEPPAASLAAIEKQRPPNMRLSNASAYNWWGRAPFWTRKPDEVRIATMG